MKIPKVDQRGSNCDSKGLLIYHLIDSYSWGYPEKNNDTLGTIVVDVPLRTHFAFACAAAAAANLPLVTRHQTISLIPATLSESKIRTCLLKGDSIAILKLGKNIVKIKKILSDLGRYYDAVYVERASMMNQKILSLSDAPDNAPYFSIILLTCAETE